MFRSELKNGARVQAHEAKPGMRCVFAGVRDGSTITRVKTVQVATEDEVFVETGQRYEGRVLVFWDDEPSYTAYRPTHTFLVIGRRARAFTGLDFI